MDALHNTAKSSALQENVHLINDIPIFKAKDPQSLNDWLDQINKVTALTNNDLYKLALAKSQVSFSEAISSFPPYRWVPLKLVQLFWEHAKSVQLISNLAYQYQFTLNYTRKRILAKIWAKWESSLTTVQLKWDPP